MINRRKSQFNTVLKEYYKNLFFTKIFEAAPPLDPGLPPEPEPPTPIQYDPEEEEGYQRLTQERRPRPVRIPGPQPIRPQNLQRPPGVPSGSWHKLDNDTYYHDQGNGVGGYYKYIPGPPSKWESVGPPYAIPEGFPGHNPNLTPEHVITPAGWKLYQHSNGQWYGLDNNGVQHSWDPATGRWEVLENPGLHWIHWTNQPGWVDGQPPWIKPTPGSYPGLVNNTPGSPFFIVPPDWDPLGGSLMPTDPYGDVLDWSLDGRPIYWYDGWGNPQYTPNPNPPVITPGFGDRLRDILRRAIPRKYGGN